MSSRADTDLIDDMQEAIRRIIAYTSDMTYDSFANDTRTQDAVLRNLEILGEAAKNVSPDLRAKHPELPWKQMAGVRDRLIHDYSGVNLDIVWQIIVDELPDVGGRIAQITSQES